jgi:branched-chain amino acid transport system ATP-binding protein
MLAVARALVGAPSVLMLDEPSAGLSPKLVGIVFEKLAEVRATGVTIVLVEQNVKAALAIADRATVLVEGRSRIVGTARELAADPQVAALYLGHYGREA